MQAVLALSLLIAGVQSSIPCDRRIDCHPERVPTKESCEARGCVYDDGEAPLGAPLCYMRADQMGYTAEKNGEEIKLTANKGPLSPWGSPFEYLRFRSEQIGNGVLNVRIEPESGRYDPASILSLPRETLPSDEKLSVDVTYSDPFSFAVKRDDGTKLFDTSIGGLVFSDKFIQLAAFLPSEKMYGWGEHIHQSLKHDFTRYTSWGMFARGDAPNSTGLHTANLYGVHPFYLLIEPSGKAHGVFIQNTNAQDVTTLPSPGLVYRTIGGLLDIYFFPGPSPSQVIAQYHAFIGRPFMPSYWALGYQLCRWGYTSLADLKDRVSAVMAMGIPLDVVYADIDYMEDRKDFTTGEKWAGFNSYVDELHSQGMSTILIFDPAVQVDYDVFQRAREKNVSFIEWERYDQVQTEIQSQYAIANETKMMLGMVWPNRHVAFPDFLDTQSSTEEWWEEEFKRYYQEIKFDGAWIDMNEPQVFSTRNTPSTDTPYYDRYPVVCPKEGPDAEWDSPPYQTHATFYYGEDAFLGQGSLCLTGTSQRGQNRLYNTKNLYGWSESKVTSAVMKKTTGRRSNVISRSTFASSGRYAGHWLGDNSATWDDLRTSISEAMEFNMFGIPYVGSDVCGFKGVSNEELCLRWQQMAAFHSFFRNHNAISYPYQDPAVWPSVAAATKRANEFRYRYLPYLYMLHHRASTLGETVIRPLFFEYPLDEKTHEIGYQFMWGRAITVAPVYTQGSSSVEVYIPDDTYYSLYENNYGSKVNAGLSSFPAANTTNIPTFVRGSSIIPRHTSSALTTTALRGLPFSFLIVPNQAGSASGSLFWDDGDAIIEDWLRAECVVADLTYSSSTTNSLTINVTRETSSISTPSLSELEIFGYPSAPDYTSFTVNGAKVSINTQASKYSAITDILTIVFTQNIAVNSQGTVVISWKNH